MRRLFLLLKILKGLFELYCLPRFEGGIDDTRMASRVNLKVGFGLLVQFMLFLTATLVAGYALPVKRQLPGNSASIDSTLARPFGDY